MQSLRTHKGSMAPPGPESARRPSQRQPAKLAKPANRDARKSRVDDRIRKRMSMRYADISSPTDIPAVPTIPMPGIREQEEVVRDRGAPKEDAKIAENRLLDKDDFDPDEFLKLKLANSTESELKSLQSSLRASREDTNVDLQRNVFKNYAEFVVISKEISTLENEMLELKSSLSEWRSMPSVLHIDDTAPPAERRRTARASIADLRVLYASQMQTLHANIEGAAKFAPMTPGRHVVAEVDGLMALNVATYKVSHAVRFVVMDDLVLVAKRRRRRNAGPRDEGKLVAERAWPLSEMLVLDTKDSANMTNVFKVKHGKETHVYRAEQASDKKSLLAQLRNVADDLTAKRRREREGEHERRKSIWQGGGGDRMSVMLDASGPAWLAELGARVGANSGAEVGAKEKTERDQRWATEFADDLTVAIALRNWEEAVSLVEDGRSKLAICPPLAGKLPELTNTLVTSLLHCLTSSTLRKTSTIQITALLTRLGFAPAARAVFLSARSIALKAQVRAIKFDGSVTTYIHDLAMVMFMSIKNTADWYLASFKENEVASSFVDWAKGQIEVYAEMFRTQVFTPDVDPRTVEDCVQISHQQSKKLLLDFGIDFRHVFDKLLVPNPSPPITVATGVVDFRISTERRAEILSTAAMASAPSPSASSTATLSVTSPLSSTTPRSRTPTQSSSTSRLRAAAPPPAPSSPIPTTPNTLVTPNTYSSTQPLSPEPRRARSNSNARSTRAESPVPSLPGARPEVGSTSITPTPRAPPRGLRSSPVPGPPPRSTNRPGSTMSTSSTGHRPPPVAVPRRDNMF